MNLFSEFSVVKDKTIEGTEGGINISNNPLIFNFFSVFSVVKF